MKIKIPSTIRLNELKQYFKYAKNKILSSQLFNRLKQKFKNIKIETPSARRHNELKQQIGELHAMIEKQQALMNEHSTETVKATNAFEKKTTSQIKSLDNKYTLLSASVNELSKEIKTLNQSVNKLNDTSVSNNYLNYDVLVKMLNAQQSMMENVLSLLEAHAVINEAELSSMLITKR